MHVSDAIFPNKPTSRGCSLTSVTLDSAKHLGPQVDSNMWHTNGTCQRMPGVIPQCLMSHMSTSSKPLGSIDSSPHIDQPCIRTAEMTCSPANISLGQFGLWTHDAAWKCPSQGMGHVAPLGIEEWTPDCAAQMKLHSFGATAMQCSGWCGVRLL